MSASRVADVRPPLDRSLAVLLDMAAV